MTAGLPLALVGDDLDVPCIDGTDRRYLNVDGAASTNALPAVAARVHDFVPWYSSVHRGAGYKSRAATNAYERARAAILVSVTWHEGALRIAELDGLAAQPW